MNDEDMPVSKVQSMTDLVKNREIKKEKRKIDYEYQELCLELEPIYGKVVWTLPHKYNLVKIRDAHKIAQQRGVLTYAYLLGVIKKLH